MSAGYNLKVAPIITNPGDVTPDFVVFGAASQTAANPLLIRLSAFSGATNLSVTSQGATTLTISSDSGTDAVIPAATTSLAGLMTAADKVALAAAGTGSTNLSIASHGATTLAIASDTGTDATIPAATTSLAGLMTAADKTALDAVGTGTTIMDAATVTPGADDFIPFINDGSTTATPAKVEATYFASAAALTSGLAGKADTSALTSGLAAKLDTTAAPELIRDTMATALVAGPNITITPNDGADTITIAASGGGGAVPNTYTDPTATVGPTVFENFFHFPPGFKFLSNIGTYGVFTEAGSTFSSTAYVGGTTLDAQTGVMSVRTAASATLQRPTFSLLEERVSALAGNGLTIGMAALVKFRPAAASNAPSATNDYWVSVGFQGANSNRIDGTAQLKFDYYWTGSAVAFEASSREGGGSVTTTALTLPTADVYTLLSVECNGFNVTFRVNGVSVATRTMTVAASQLRPQILINQTTAANVNGIDVDWATYYVKGLTR